MIVNLGFINTNKTFSGPMCRKAYQNHPHGCPNFNKKQGCPPNHKDFWEVFSRDFYLIYTSFDLETHITRMRKKHPHWTKRQLHCCLYWQGTARKNLYKEIERFQKLAPNHLVTTCPEAMGVDVTALMDDNCDIELEWPPETITYQVAIAGLSKP